MTPYLFFNGQCREALEFYAGLFDGEVHDLMTYGELPDQEVDAGIRDWTMHARLVVGDKELMASDDMEGKSEAPRGMWIQMSIPVLGDAAAIYAALGDGGEEVEKFAPTFFSPGFGTVRDRWGMPWMIMCVPPEA